MNAPFNYIVNPSVPVNGIYNAITGLWTAQLPSQIYDRDLTGLSLQGPGSSMVKVYLGPVDPQNLIDQTQRGNSNTADYSGGPRHVPRGQFVTVVWSPLGGVFTGTEIVSCTFFVKQQG
jgi:hypothetical protein